MKIGHLALSGQAWLYFQSGSSNHDIWLGPKHAQRLHKAFTAIAKNPCLSLVNCLLRKGHWRQSRKESWLQCCWYLLGKSLRESCEGNGPASVSFVCTWWCMCTMQGKGPGSMVRRAFHLQGVPGTSSASPVKEYQVLGAVKSISLETLESCFSHSRAQNQDNTDLVDLKGNMRQSINNIALLYFVSIHLELVLHIHTNTY